MAGGSWAAAEENWPQWRGASQNGVSHAKGLPTKWSDTENIVWRTPLPSWSGGSPVIWGNRIFLPSPSASDDDQDRNTGRAPKNPGGQKLLLMCLAKDGGRVLWTRDLDEGNKVFRKHNNSSPSPVTDGSRVWAMTGTGVISAFDMDGNPLWSKDLQAEYGTFGLMFGYGSSPLLYQGMIIVQVLHGYTTDDPSYLVAFDALTGEERWRVERPTDAEGETPDAYTTPTLLEHGGQVQIIVAGANYVTGHDPATGAEVWRGGGINPKANSNWRVIPSPVAVDGMVYVPSRKRPLLAFRAGGVGDVTDTHRAWAWDELTGPDVPTPACDGTYFYMAEDRGKATCLDAKSGEVVWGPERTVRGTVSASPIVADGKVYIVNEDATTIVLAAGKKFKILAENHLEEGGYTLSTPAISGKQLFLRTGRYLYCIGEPAR